MRKYERKARDRIIRAISEVGGIVREAKRQPECQAVRRPGENMARKAVARCAGPGGRARESACSTARKDPCRLPREGGAGLAPKSPRGLH